MTADERSEAAFWERMEKDPGQRAIAEAVDRLWLAATDTLAPGDIPVARSYFRLGAGELLGVIADKVDDGTLRKVMDAIGVQRVAT